MTDLVDLGRSKQVASITLHGLDQHTSFTRHYERFEWASKTLVSREMLSYQLGVSG